MCGRYAIFDLNAAKISIILRGSSLRKCEKKSSNVTGTTQCSSGENFKSKASFVQKLENFKWNLRDHYAFAAPQIWVNMEKFQPGLTFERLKFLKF